MLEQFITFLRSHTHFSAEDVAVIQQQVTLCPVKEGEVLLKEGHTARQLFFICSGVLKIVSVNDKGNDVVHFFLKQNQFCTVLNSFTNNVPAHEGIIAACDAELVVLNKDALQNIYALVPQLQPLIETVTHKTLLDKLALKNNYNGKDATERYQTFLHVQPEIAQQAALGDIASYLGITIQSLSRIRKNIKWATCTKYNPVMSWGIPLYGIGDEGEVFFYHLLNTLPFKPSSFAFIKYMIWKTTMVFCMAKG